jgi:hypothetical protein
MRDVVLDGLVGQEERGCDLCVCHAAGKQPQDLGFAGRETGRIGPGARTPAAWHALAQGTQPFGSECRRGPGIQAVKDVESGALDGGP